MSRYERAVQTWQGWQVRSAADIDQHLDSFRILFAYHSGKIENSEITYHDTREIFENGKVSGYTGSPWTLFEQQNQKLCYEVLKGKIADREPISMELVREVHCILTSGTYDERRYIDNGERPGEFKKHDYVTGIHEVGSAPEDVEPDLQELIQEVNEIGRSAPLKAGAYLHACFEAIHPFADGNGRVGRALLNYWLMANDYPPTIIFDEDKQSYYRALQLYDEQDDIAPLAEFLEQQTVKTWDRAMALTEGQPQERRGLTEFL